jgi:hypothetical protein
VCRRWQQQQRFMVAQQRSISTYKERGEEVWKKSIPLRKSFSTALLSVKALPMWTWTAPVTSPTSTVVIVVCSSVTRLFLPYNKPIEGYKEPIFNRYFYDK